MWGFILVLIIVSVEIAECVGSVLGVCWVSVERKPFLCKEKPSGKSFFLQERKNLGKKETKNGKGKLQERKNSEDKETGWEKKLMGVKKGRKEKKRHRKEKWDTE